MASERNFDCVIVGAGPAGMMAAAMSARQGYSTALLEKNDIVGRKLLLSGGGRCNITNTLPVNDFLRALGPNGGFIRSALAAFGRDQVIEFLRGLGISLCEESSRLYVNGGARAFVNALARLLEDSRVRVFFNERVERVGLGPTGAFEIITLNGRFVARRKVIIAAGGNSYPTTGSNGDGFTLARQLGHDIVAPLPAMGPIRLSENPFTGLAGVSTPEVGVDVDADGKSRGKFVGGLLVTHHGLSGPVILDASLVLARCLQAGKSPSVTIDFLPAVERNSLDTQLRSDAAPTAALRVLPRRLRDRLLKHAGVEVQAGKVQLTRANRHRLIETLKSLTLPVANTGSWQQAMVTVGGVSLKQIDPATMESRLVKGLYFAGEVLDIAGNCGGFNIQAALSTGYLAGMNQ
jgi:hypothetical protein